jgi:hypothetical protein
MSKNQLSTNDDHFSTSQMILERAIQKAIDGGYINGIAWLDQVRTNYAKDYNYSGLLFNHDFAKALWGEELITVDCYTLPNFDTEDSQGAHEYSLPRWQYHLQSMVISDDPITYLGEHLDD